MRQAAAIIIALAAGTALGLLIGRRQQRPPRDIIVTETVRVDTLRDTVPMPVATRAAAPRRRRLPLAAPPDTTAASDTTAATDSADVIVPVTQAVYSDSLYTAWVSGYEPRLDSIAIYAPVRTVTITRPAPAPRRWGLGLAVGYGYSPARGFAPWIGVGLTYTLVTF